MASYYDYCDYGPAYYDPPELDYFDSEPSYDPEPSYDDDVSYDNQDYADAPTDEIYEDYGHGSGADMPAYHEEGYYEELEDGCLPLRIYKQLAGVLEQSTKQDGILWPLKIPKVHPNANLAPLGALKKLDYDWNVVYVAVAHSDFKPQGRVPQSRFAPLAAHMRQDHHMGHFCHREYLREDFEWKDLEEAGVARRRATQGGIGFRKTDIFNYFGIRRISKYSASSPLKKGIHIKPSTSCCHQRYYTENLERRFKFMINLPRTSGGEERLREGPITFTASFYVQAVQAPIRLANIYKLHIIGKVQRCKIQREWWISVESQNHDALKTWDAGKARA
ncbi:hypothetical protein B0H13DRAFT_1863947 [Mycena leptocephala]|nr:hypothetical protein B0H13DRAFT_1863947 [Mycena leptocephala]